MSAQNLDLSIGIWSARFWAQKVGHELDPNIGGQLGKDNKKYREYSDWL